MGKLEEVRKKQGEDLDSIPGLQDAECGGIIQTESEIDFIKYVKGRNKGGLQKSGR